MREIENYRIEINGEWSLVDFHEFPYAYTQAYSFLYSLLIEEVRDDDKLALTFFAFPWRGGYSVVNFFHYLYRLIPRAERPQIVSIRYSSPGWIELGLVLLVALSLKRIIDTICDGTLRVNETYNQIYKGMQERKLLSLSVKSEELKLDRESLKFIEDATNTLAKLMGFESYARLLEQAPNELAALKMLMAFYRRVRKLKEYQEEDKLKF